MILLWLTAILSRNVIRAHWWAHQLAAAESPNARLGYFYRLASLGDTAVPAVSTLLASDDAGLRSFAVAVLHHAPGDRTFQRLMQASRDVDLDVCRLAVQGLAMRREKRSVSDLASIVAASDERRAMIATAALADVGSEPAKRALIDLLRSSPHPGVRVEAIEGLETLRARGAIEPLIDALNDDAAFEGVTERGMTAVRAFEAVRADLARSSDRPEAVSLHVEDRHVVWRSARRALRTITGHSFDFTEAAVADRITVAKTWRDWWRSKANENITSTP